MARKRHRSTDADPAALPSTDADDVSGDSDNDSSDNDDETSSNSNSDDDDQNNDSGKKRTVDRHAVASQEAMALQLLQHR